MFVELRQRFFALRHKPATLGVGLLICVLGYHVVFGANGLFVYQQKRKESRALQGQIERMKQQNASLEKQIKALKSDPQTIEKEARERLRYAPSRRGHLHLVPTATSVATAEKIES